MPSKSHKQSHLYLPTPHKQIEIRHKQNNSIKRFVSQMKVQKEGMAYNFIMKNKTKGAENPQTTASFQKENRKMDKHEMRLNIEILRVHTIEKLRDLAAIWTMNQTELCDFFSHYRLFPQQCLTLESLLADNKLKLIKSDGKLYFGLIENKRREGRGISLHRGGKVYEGEFSNNEKQGQAVEIYPNGNLYIGEFMNSKKHGDGTFYWFNLSSRNPKSDEFVEYYEGQWWGGLPDGYGTHQKINGDLYTGTFKNGLKHGEGAEFYGNGDYYKGQFINGMPQGYGEYIWEDSSSFKGDFKQGLRNGYGVWRASKHRIQSYKGHYVMDKKSGHGIYTWDNGWYYKGNFDNDSRNGYGELYDYDNAIHYRGFWTNGEQTEKEPDLVGRDKQTNFKSTQYSRYETIKKDSREKYDIFQNRSRASTKLGRHPELDSINIAHGEHYVGRRPQSHHGTKMRRGACTMVINRSNQKLNESVRERTNSSFHRGMIGTIKSNMFVPSRYNSAKKS